MKKVYEKLIEEETVRYLLFGVMTTIVNFGSYILCDFVIGKKYYLISNIFSFFMATIFAFVTNKAFVFKSRNWKCMIVLKETVAFVSARIGTFLIIEELGLWVFVHIFRAEMLQWYFFDGILMSKVFLSFVAVLANYVLSKKVVFRER